MRGKRGTVNGPGGLRGNGGHAIGMRTEDGMKLSIPDMTGEESKATVERAIIDIDSAADVIVDLDAKTAEVRTTAAEGAILNALRAGGYPAAVVA